MGSIEFEPPISAEISAETLTRAASSTARRARRHSSPCLIFSTLTTGAPIPPTEPMASSSPIASSGSTSTRAPLRKSSRARSMPTWGLPPPPVPSTAAPSESGRRSASARTYRSRDIQVSDHLDMHARRVARQIGEGHVLDVDHLDRAGVRAGGDRDRARLFLGVANGVGPAHRGKRVNAVSLARHLRDGRADGVGDREMMRLDHLEFADLALDQNRAAANDDDWQ